MTAVQDELRLKDPLMKHYQRLVEFVQQEVVHVQDMKHFLKNTLYFKEGEKSQKLLDSLLNSIKKGDIYQSIEYIKKQK